MAGEKMVAVKLFFKKVAEKRPENVLQLFRRKTI
jgi:hypothetical protein